VFAGGVGIVAVVLLVWPLQSGHWVQQLSLPFFPLLQLPRDSTSPVSDRPSSQPVDLLAAVPYTPLFLLGIGFQLEPVRFPQAFLKWGLV